MADPALVEAPRSVVADAVDHIEENMMDEAMSGVSIHSTMAPRAEINVTIEAQRLKIAMQKFITDNKDIIDVLTTTNNEQKQLINTEYKRLFGRELRDDIHNQTMGNFRKTCEALLRTPDEFDAECVRNAVKGLGTDEETLIEIICTSTNDEIRRLKEEYKSMYSRDIEKDVSSDLSGNMKTVMASLLQGNRSEIPKVDMEMAKADAKNLYEAGEGRWGTDESVFNTILVSKSYPQLQATFKEYKKISGHEIMVAIDKEFSGDICRAMKTIVQCVKNRNKFYALRLHKAMKQIFRTDNATLIRVTVRRCESGMGGIKHKFKQEYNESLQDCIVGTTSGDYRLLLLNLLAKPDIDIYPKESTEVKRQIMKYIYQ